MVNARRSILTLVFATLGESALDLGFENDSDLTSFVTRPDIKAPLFNVEIYHQESLADGYWFVAPYVKLRPHSYPKNSYQPCQIGPHIYDHFGNLVWSGACDVENQNTFDFRAWEVEDEFVMTAILGEWPEHGDKVGHGLVMDSAYDVTHTLGTPDGVEPYNMHEMQLVDDDATALQILSRSSEMDVTKLQLPNRTVGTVRDTGFREVDLVTGETLFEWWALDEGHCQLIESNVEPKFEKNDKPHIWDWFHANSVHKSVDGDYLLSSRYTDTIYKISGEDGSITWRFGGRYSSFFLDGFNFSRQHDARWLSIDGDRDTETLTFFNNAADDVNHTSSTSSALTVELDLSRMSARVLREIPRPDGQLTRLRGNHQPLPSGNTFVCWSENSYLSEHDAHGELLMQARFRSDRFATYRAYKQDFRGSPREPPVVTAVSIATSRRTCETVIYVSWNGATEVALWRFVDELTGEVVGEKGKTGFETVFQTKGCLTKVFAQALGADGELLGRSLAADVTRLVDGEEEEEDVEGDSPGGNWLDHVRTYVGSRDEVAGDMMTLRVSRKQLLIFAVTVCLVAGWSVLRTLRGRRVWAGQAVKLVRVMSPDV